MCFDSCSTNVRSIGIRSEIPCGPIKRFDLLIRALISTQNRQNQLDLFAQSGHLLLVKYDPKSSKNVSYIDQSWLLKFSLSRDASRSLTHPSSTPLIPSESSHKSSHSVPYGLRTNLSSLLPKRRQNRVASLPP
ncbi:hypothetical protein L596_019887 [Steinernema carpocapsae]|uniref:Uncharacterized protein n=1 Tax=Steinernema carpocapsae TaxID=34508 RepID=A0A4U5MS18_STECR|nr:hypothetical protein L596_019887 [Steinernema carpocapsae]